ATMGFRGEALSSIASVAKVTLKSARADEQAGKRIIVEGGKIIENIEDGAATGTSVEVADLFYNTPARAKFLKSTGAEFARINETFKKIALAHPELGFKLIHGSSKIIEASPGTLKNRVLEIYGKAVLNELIEIQVDVPQENINITGLIGKPTLNYPTGKGLLNFINKRPIRDAGLTRAAILGYGSLIDRGRYPFALIFLDIDTESIDVNVHPAKNEVRFKDPAQVFDAVRYAVKKTLSTASEVIGMNAETFSGEGRSRYREPFSASLNRSSKAAGFSDASPVWQGREPVDTKRAQNEPLEFINPNEDVLTPEFLKMEVIGQVWNEFLLCQSFGADGEMSFYIIDQHGASERARFERLKKEYNSSTVTSQLLLLPERVETDMSEAETLTTALTELNKLGFKIESFGPSTKKDGETFMIKSTPAINSGGSAGSLILELSNELAEFDQSTRIEERIEKILMTIACHSVIRGSRMMSSEEARGLLKELSRIDFAAHCPHGRPVVKKFSRAEIEKLFGRI
ncbi:MAG: DNA mismatch repair endonuclease MutL, partial [Thermodesulfobacteriota bacterium]